MILFRYAIILLFAHSDIERAWTRVDAASNSMMCRCNALLLAVRDLDQLVHQDLILPVNNHASLLPKLLSLK